MPGYLSEKARADLRKLKKEVLDKRAEIKAIIANEYDKAKTKVKSRIERGVK